MVLSEIIFKLSSLYLALLVRLSREARCSVCFIINMVKIIIKTTTIIIANPNSAYPLRGIVFIETIIMPLHAKNSSFCMIFN